MFHAVKISLLILTSRGLAHKYYVPVYEVSSLLHTKFRILQVTDTEQKPCLGLVFTNVARIVTVEYKS